MDLLARREHSRLELERKLLDRGFEPAHVAQALDRLAVEGLLEESRFVESFIHARARKGHGPARIRGDLIQRGIDESQARAGLAAADCDWRALCADARVKRFGAAAPADVKARARQVKFLQYRGFESDHVRAALDLD
jgi:regulatory protein